MTFPMVFFAAAGLFCLLAAAFDWKFFLEHRKASVFVRLFGRGGARVFYGLFGAALIFAGLAFPMFRS